jgi:hypothetical protein
MCMDGSGGGLHGQVTTAQSVRSIESAVVRCNLARGHVHLGLPPRGADVVMRILSSTVAAELRQNLVLAGG